MSFNLKARLNLFIEGKKETLILAWSWSIIMAETVSSSALLPDKPNVIKFS